ncbi:Protein NOI4 [Glycine soja]
MSEKGRPLPKFGEWDVNDPASAEGFTVIFNKARDEKKTGGNPESPGKTATDPHSKPAVEPGKTQTIDQRNSGLHWILFGKNGFAACKTLLPNHSIAMVAPVKSLNRRTMFMCN